MPKYSSANERLALGLGVSLMFGALVGAALVMFLPFQMISTLVFLGGILAGGGPMFVLGLNKTPIAHLGIPVTLNTRSKTVVIEEGWCWLVPFLQRLETMSNKTVTIIFDELNGVTSKENVVFTLEVSAAAKIVDPYRAGNVEHLFGDDDGATGIVRSGHCHELLESAARQFAKNFRIEDNPDTDTDDSDVLQKHREKLVEFIVNGDKKDKDAGSDIKDGGIMAAFADAGVEVQWVKIGRILPPKELMEAQEKEQVEKSQRRAETRETETFEMLARRHQERSRPYELRKVVKPDPDKPGKTIEVMEEVPIGPPTMTYEQALKEVKILRGRATQHYTELPDGSGRIERAAAIIGAKPPRKD